MTWPMMWLRRLKPETRVAGSAEQGLESGFPDIQACALRLLARREHGRRELYGKLTRKGLNPEAVDRVLDALESAGSLSDERYAQGFVRERLERGWGRDRIYAELMQRGITETLAEAALEEQSGREDWRERMEAVRRKKFGPDKPGDYEQRARQARFLQYRGFPMDQIRSLIFG